MGTDAASERLEVGRIGRPHGLRGEVTVVLITDRAERTEPGAVLYAGERRLVVEAARTHANRMVVRFAGVEDRDAAEALRGRVLSADPLVGHDDVLWVHEVVGAEVHDVKGTRLGIVTAVDANPAHDLLVLDDGALVPVVFVVEHAPGRVVVDTPAGLLET